jgi:predicted metal-binding membrane protein
MLHALLRRDRALVMASLVAVIALAWAYLILGAGIEMDEMTWAAGRS